jgi:hypothetical protein
LQSNIFEKVSTTAERVLVARSVFFVVGNFISITVLSSNSEEAAVFYGHGDAKTGKFNGSLPINALDSSKNATEINISKFDILFTSLHLILMHSLTIKDFILDHFNFLTFSVVTRELDLLRRTFACIKNGDKANLLRRQNKFPSDAEVTQQEWLRLFYKVRRLSFYNNIFH